LYFNRGHIMNRIEKITCNILFVLAFGCALASAQTGQASWGGSAEKIYDNGFMHMLMKHPEGGVSLFNIDLVENDSPGAGVSEKGVCSDFIWGKNRARKILHINDVRAHKASLFVFSHRRGNHPLHFKINGHESQIDTWKRKGYERFRWVDFPVEWLKKGENRIELFCPEAQTMEEGWEIWLARADEFTAGGGDPKDVGKTSYASTDGGKSWKQSPFGLSEGASLIIDGFDVGKSAKKGSSEADGKDRAEYSVRISLNRYIEEGWLESPVIDLWKGDSKDSIVRMRTIQKLKITIKSDVPEGTGIDYYLRKGINPGPYDDDWEDYELVGSGQTLNIEIPGGAFNRRFLQFKAVLTTGNPLLSPVVKSAQVTADFKETFPVPRHKNIFVLESDNPPVRYSSIDWEWEKWDRQEFKELRTRENLDKVIAGSRTTFEAQIKLLDYATKRWRWTPPIPEYPEWDALSILDRSNKYGGGGMCIQFNNLLAGACMAYGWQARLINIDGHEVCEVWNDDYGKWIYLDASNVNHYQCDIETGVPLNMLDLHYKYLDYFFKDRKIDWLNDYRYSSNVYKERPDKPAILRSSPTYHDVDSGVYTGFNQARFLRMVPRNNWYAKPHPRPLSHGNGSHWPWNSYINWYDEKSPPRLQYSWHTDRPRDMWPDLNTVHIHVTQGYGNDRLFLQFETYTPNFCHFEVNTDDNGWEAAAEQYMWLLVPGRNTIRVRTVNKLGAQGKPSSITVNRIIVPLKEWTVETLKSLYEDNE